MRPRLRHRAANKILTAMRANAHSQGNVKGPVTHIQVLSQALSEAATHARTLNKCQQSRYISNETFAQKLEQYKTHHDRVVAAMKKASPRNEKGQPNQQWVNFFSALRTNNYRWVVDELRDCEKLFLRFEYGSGFLVATTERVQFGDRKPTDKDVSYIIQVPTSVIGASDAIGSVRVFVADFLPFHGHNPHPHIGAGQGTPCFGGYGGTISRYLQTGQIYEMFSLMATYIRGYSPSDAFRPLQSVARALENRTTPDAHFPFEISLPLVTGNGVAAPQLDGGGVDIDPLDEEEYADDEEEYYYCPICDTEVEYEYTTYSENEGMNICDSCYADEQARLEEEEEEDEDAVIEDVEA